MNDMTDWLQKTGDAVSEYKDLLITQFKDMDIEVKAWNFTSGKLEKEYSIEVNVKLWLKPKKA